MTTLIITRGLPASGKSTLARAWVDEDRDHRAEVNRDHLRMMLHGVEWSGSSYLENQVTAAQHASIAALLDQGISVISSDTNLQQRYVRDLAKIAKQAGADIKIIDLSHVPLDTCIQRDAERGARGERKVGEPAIRGMHRRYIAPLNSGGFPLPKEDTPTGTVDFVDRDWDLETVVICDIDGTIARMQNRKPYDYTKVSTDKPKTDVIEVVNMLWSNGNGYKIVFMSGREGTEQCRRDTLAWIDEHLHVWGYELHMRPEGDFRKDNIVKRELFEKHIRGTYNVLGVFDDRDQVVRMWREELGLTCYQVAPGNF